MTDDRSRDGDATTRPPSMRERWQLDGGIAESYERYLVPVLFAPWAERLVQLAAPGPGERVLDVACGTGIVARRAAARVGVGGAVAGLDLNQSTLEVARAAAAQAGASIEWRAGDVAGLPFPDGAFEIVFCQQGLQFFPDRALALREMRRVLVPGGRLALSVWRPIRYSPGFAVLAQMLERHAGPGAAAVMHAPFAGPDGETLRQLLTGAGFGAVRLVIGIGGARFPSPGEFLRQEAASSPLAGPVGALDADARRALAGDLQSALQPYRDDDGVIFPVQTWLITAARQGAARVPSGTATS
jgi:ubiquinone/menaquinone biosynthesis C-methylase UbiE